MSDSIRLKWLLSESDIRAGTKAETLPLLSVSISWGVRRREATDTTTRAAAEDLSNYKICRAGDLVINRMRAFQGALGIAPEDGIVSPDYAVLRVSPRIDTRWLEYFLASRSTVATMASLVRGIGGTEAGNVRTPRLNIADLLSMTAPLVSAGEQSIIADYLDHETACIDTLIEEQQRLIEMLSERRVATVAETLDGCERTQVRRLVNHDRPMTYGILQCGEPVDGGVVYIGPSDIQGEGLSPDRDALRTTAPEIASAYKRSILKSGDVVVSIGPAYGKVAVVSDDLTGANLTQDTVRVALRPDLVDTRFFVWALLSRQTAEYWDYQIMGATFRRLNLGTLARTPIPLPAIQEQRRIAAYLDEQTAKIDSLIAETERFIDLARERRSALITAAVTGQIDVREAA
ncbi:restriction endonuclease subunit S [Streptomyces microflavus]|uniref:restriction endonuclease subunit S n=1 Tax=Streptomyces microflavus TaxID=1919 RepID=UPI0033BCCE2D